MRVTEQSVTLSSCFRAPLRPDVEPFPRRQMRRKIKKELKVDISLVVGAILTEPQNSASLENCSDPNTKSIKHMKQERIFLNAHSNAQKIMTSFQ